MDLTFCYTYLLYLLFYAHFIQTWSRQYNTEQRLSIKQFIWYNNKRYIVYIPFRIATRTHKHFQSTYIPDASQYVFFNGMHLQWQIFPFPERKMTRRYEVWNGKQKDL